MKKLLFILLLAPLFVFGQTQTQITSNQIKSNPLKVDSLYSGVTQSIPSYGGGLFILFGNSIGTGSFLTDTTQAFGHVVATQLGESIRNYSVIGSVMEKRSPLNPTGGYNMVDNMTNVPAYSAGTTKWLCIELGINDWFYAGANYTSANFTTDATTVWNYLTTTKGWPGNRIILLGSNRVQGSLYGTTGTGGGTRTLVNQQAFNTAAQAICTTYGSIFIDTYTAFLNDGGDALVTGGGIHPNLQGHQIIANLILQAIKQNTVYKRGYNAASNGNVEFNQIIYGNKTQFPLDSGYLVGVNSSGRLNKLSNIPYQTFINYPIFQGGMSQTGIVPATFTSKDFLFNQDTRLMGAYAADNTLYTWIKLANSGASMDFGSTFSNASYNFYNNTSTKVFLINSVGDISPLSNVALNSGKSVTCDVGDIAFGYFYPLDASNNTRIQNKYGIGRIDFFSSNGTNGGAVETMSLWPTGELTLQKTTPFNNTIDKLNLYSNSQGFGLPRLSNAARDSLGFVASVTMTNFGSGYTSTPTVTFSAPTGGGVTATGTANLSGSTVGSITITNKGTGYTANPTITITGGGGSSAAATANLSLNGNQGLLFHSLTTGLSTYWDGSEWASHSATVASADITAQTTAGNITTYTVGSSTATFNISSYLNVTAISTDIIQVQITYTDENNTAQTISLANQSAVGNANYNPVTIRAKNATTITVKTNLSTSGGSVTFDAGARIAQI